MKGQDLPIGMVVGRMLGRMGKVFKRELNEAQIDITLEQLGLLHAISENEQDVVQQDMADIMNKDKSAILRLIDSLEKKGLVVRSIDPQDRRKNLLFVTEQGMAVLVKIGGVAAEINPKFVENISQADLDTFFAVAEKIKQNAERLI
ncbi:MarR family winged helix-turn-helix transcriptional regulator [Alistipes sp. ZOR0009]|jgi:MarR family transcriptional regulator for hemolysin|uniref:MarR family winged helix-turn-helix transcriptional regulator n=1 Tax=Alistipes sp. ZOR0009 TaxID=1339253 RepID=UPI000648E942|nr:MarR family transcriptional regulator [Alistipes sp. ZOR0009]